MSTRSLFLSVLGLAGALVACGGSSEGTDTAGADFTLNPPATITNACAAWHALRAQVPLVSAQPCGPIAPFATQIGQELAILWNTEPSSVCGYSGLGRSNACGPLFTNNAFYCGGDDSISYDIDLMNRLFGEHTSFAPVAVLAHEWGHLNQNRTGLNLPPRVTLQNELNADCQAGIFTAVEELEGHLDVGDAQGAFQTFCEFGDPATPWFNPNGHGTCAQRTASFVTGYNGGKAFANAVCSPNGISAMLQICAN
jgi:hypothetical protein